MFDEVIKRIKNTYAYKKRNLREASFVCDNE